MTAPTSTQTPAREVARALVAAIRADTAWTHSGGWLFPAWSPSRDELDFRVYSGEVELPERPGVVGALPRLLLDCQWTAHDYEQDGGILMGPVTLYLHVLSPRDQADYGDALVTAAILKVRSTPLSGDRIIASELVHTATVPKARIAAFGGAFEWIPVFRSANVGVVA